jgi:uncharacterized membrane protein YfcA
MFGVGGGFLTTPLLIFYGVPPAVAVASSASQMTGASVSGVFAHSRRKGVDYQDGRRCWSRAARSGRCSAGWVFRLLQRAARSIR